MAPTRTSSEHTYSDLIMKIMKYSVTALMILGAGGTSQWGTPLLFAQTHKAPDSTPILIAATGRQPVGDPAPTKVGRTAPRELYRKHCLECHDADGRGTSAREITAHVPDFTDTQWHRSRGDSELARIIWDGKKSMMPAMKGKLTKADLDGLVLLIRDFRGGRVQVPEDPVLEEEAGIQSKSIVESEPPGSPWSENGPERGSRMPSETAVRLSHDGLAATRAVYQKFCSRCHGPSGDGSSMRETIPALPDFTSLAWHHQKQDSRLTVAILDGKGKAMPPFQERMDAEVATELVVYLRSLAGLKPAPAQDPLAEFDAQFSKLMAQLETLKRDYHALTMQGSTDEPVSASERRRSVLGVHPIHSRLADSRESRKFTNVEY
jgi:mono/diheme cytochrome c family protein